MKQPTNSMTREDYLEVKRDTDIAPITRAEDKAALQELIAQERHQLAKLKRFIAFQRDVLNAPQAHYTESEAAAMRCAQAIAHYTAELGKL